MSGVVKDETDTGSGEMTSQDSLSSTSIAEGGAPIQNSEGSTSDAEDTPASPARKAGQTLRLVSDNQAIDTVSETPDSASSPLEPSPLTGGAGHPAAMPDPAASNSRIGDVVRAQRENLGYTHDQISKELRLHVSILKAIEDMNPSALGARVYALGHIRDYSRYLQLDPKQTLERFKAECAILADPVKKEIVATPTTRGMPGAAPVFGLLVTALVIGGGVFVFMNSPNLMDSFGSRPAVDASGPASVDAAAVEAAAAPVVTGPPLRLVALKRARIEFRGADGTKFLARYFTPGETYSPRTGAGWSVSASDGSAFEWRIGDLSLGLLGAEGAVYSDSVDAALDREATPILPEDIAAETAPVPNAAHIEARPAVNRPARTTVPPTTQPAARPRVQQPNPTATAPAPLPQPAPEVVDPALLAYPE